MARLLVRSGVNPDEPDMPVVTLVVDPDGPPGEDAVARLGDYCYEGDGAFHLLPTDGWVEHVLDGDRLEVAVAVYPFALGQVGVDASSFPDRSAVDPEAAMVLRAECAVDPDRYALTPPLTAVFTAGPDRAPGDVGTDADDWPIVFGLRPER
ncbi:hypothetical protein [Streptomyces sp. NPDC047985]|uniref:hypothetical protein n=1 Tax=Streptomyces sp. NPDC047985 TaxID=3155384 RepID=UPI0034189054